MEKTLEENSPQFQPSELINFLIDDDNPDKAIVMQSIQDYRIRFEGGNGNSQEEAIVMCGVKKSQLGIILELGYLQKLGRLPYTQKRYCPSKNRILEGFQFQDGTWTWFDITEWFGKL